MIEKNSNFLKVSPPCSNENQGFTARQELPGSETLTKISSMILFLTKMRFLTTPSQYHS